LAITDTISGGVLGVDYIYTGNVAGDDLTGNSGNSFAFSTGISVINSAKYFSTGPSISNATGVFDATNTVTTSISGQMTALTHTLNITNGSSGLGSSTMSVSSTPSSYTRVQDVGIGTTVHFTSSCSPGTGYQWVQLPTVSASGLPSGVVLGATSGASVGGTGDVQVSIASNWQPSSAGTTNASVTWTGGSVQAIPARRSTSISSYGGVTTYAQCASRSMPVTVYFSDTTSPYTGIRNGDTLYTSATGNTKFSSGSGYKTNVASGYGTALGTITISNGVVSNSNTSFC
jgi:hypothetical protein